MQQRSIEMDLLLASGLILDCWRCAGGGLKLGVGWHMCMSLDISSWRCMDLRKLQVWRRVRGRLSLRLDVGAGTLRLGPRHMAHCDALCIIALRCAQGAQMSAAHSFILKPSWRRAAASVGTAARTDAAQITMMYATRVALRGWMNVHSTNFVKQCCRNGVGQHAHHRSELGLQALWVSHAQASGLPVVK